MLYIIKILIAALVIFAFGEISKRSVAMSAIYLAFPIVSITAFIWIYIDSGDLTKVADISLRTFWFLIATLPMFLVLTILLRIGYNFYISLSACCLMTIALFITVEYLSVN